MKRITKLTDEMRAIFPAIIEEWTAKGLDCTPVDRALVEDGMRRCYGYAGIPWHGNVVWVGAPIVVALAAPVASHYLAVGGAVDGAVDGAVRGAVRDAVRGAVYDAVGDAFDGAVYGAVRGFWSRYLGGQWWAYWRAWRATFRRLGLELPNDMWGRFQAEADASGAGWWWPHRRFVIVADRPTFIHRERVGPPGWNSHRMHREDGPAIAWGSQWALWFWHGVNVPQWVIESPTVERIAAEKNTETRRCAIESLGWPTYLDALDLTPVSVEDDPGNHGRELALYDVPDARTLFGGDVRLLVMRNASLDRDGSRRTFAETVPSTCQTAIDAAAWQFDVDPTIYRTLVRAT